MHKFLNFSTQKKFLQARGLRVEIVASLGCGDDGFAGFRISWFDEKFHDFKPQPSSPQPPTFFKAHIFLQTFVLCMTHFHPSLSFVSNLSSILI